MLLFYALNFVVLLIPPIMPPAMLVSGHWNRLDRALSLRAEEACLFPSYLPGSISLTAVTI